MSKTARRAPKKETKHDWSRLDAMTDEERHAAAMADPDAQPMTDEDWQAHEVRAASMDHPPRIQPQSGGVRGAVPHPHRYASGTGSRGARSPMPPPRPICVSSPAHRTRCARPCCRGRFPNGKGQIATSLSRRMAAVSPTCYMRPHAGGRARAPAPVSNPMDKSIATPAPYFDAGEAGRELMALLAAQKGRRWTPGRPCSTSSKQLLRTARTEAERQLAADGNGRRCAEGLSAFQDELIRLVYDYTVANVYRATNPSDAERMAIIATGGYGRGLLAPFSDVDLLFLLPYKQTPWGESVVEYMLYLLWDLGLKVGHATRTVEQCAQAGARRHHHPHRAARCAPDPGRRSPVRRADAPLPARGRERDGPPVRRGQAGRARRAPPPRGRSRAIAVEPNIKDGKGGLRDLHTLHWLAKYLYGDGVNPATVAAQVFTLGGVHHLPPLRGLPLDDPLQPALPGGPRGGAADLRRAAGDRRAAGLRRSAAACARSSAS